MQIFNSDGSNGVRCFARFIAELENLQGKQSFTVYTGDGLIVPEIQEDGKVKDDMGQPNLMAPDVHTKITPNKDQVAVKAKLDENGLIWNGANLLLYGLRNIAKTIETKQNTT
ncbi:hypothetical protein ACS0TY_027755 [Phlomoides rotata]